MRLRTFTLGILAGAAIAYLFDPVSGRGRRSRLRDQAMARARDAGRRAESRSRYLAQMVQGKVAEMASPGPDRFVDDVTLLQRIRGEVLGRADVPKDRISLDVVHAVATLRGELDSQEEIEELASRVRSVPGVADVAVLIHLPGRTAPNKEAASTTSRDAEATTPSKRSFG